MDFKHIHELVKLINKSNIAELSVEQGDFKISIKQKKEDAQNELSTSAATIPSLIPVGKQDTPKRSSSTDSVKEDNLIAIKSPMVGTFYRQAGPGKPIFVNVGDEVVSGTIVCIIEAMKLFNEIESEVTGKVVKVLVEDASPVEFDQPLFLVEPSA